MPATFATATDTGQVRSANEDALFARPPVFMVADGMGGAAAGEVASGATARAFEWFMPQTADSAAELTNLIKKVNRSIFDMAGEHGGSGMGTTVTAAVTSAQGVTFAHVGDSRAYLWRQGRLRQLTEDHSLVAEMVRQGQISADEARDHPQRSVITRALGVEPEVEVDTQTLALEPGDLFLLCSDGLYSMVGDDSLAELLSRGRDLMTIAAQLVDEANRQGGHDNISVVLFCPDGSIASGAGQPDAAISIPHLQDRGTAPVMATTPPPGRRDVIDRLHLGWFARTLPGQLTTAFLIAVFVLGGGLAASREAYFLGIEDGHVAIYRGVPYAIGPYNLYNLYSKSAIRVDDLQPYEKDRVGSQELHTLSGAQQIIDNYASEIRQQRQQDLQNQQKPTSTTSGSSSPGTLPDGTPATLPGGQPTGR